MNSNMTLTCTRGYLLPGGTSASAHAGIGAYLVKPLQRERFIAVATAGVNAAKSVRLQAPTADIPMTVPTESSALTCELRT